MSTQIDNLTPAMRQYMELKSAHPEEVLLFRMGDFYEIFFEDAKKASRILGIALTARDRAKEIPMCGVPFHAASSYIAKLVKEGLGVAVCEQFETKKGLFERSVVRVITPGMAFDPEMLDPSSNNFVAAVCSHDNCFGVALLDATTGEFLLTEVGSVQELNDELRRYNVSELVIEESATFEISDPAFKIKKTTAMPRYDFSLQAAGERLRRQFGTLTLTGFGCDAMPHALRSAGALIHYARQTQKSDLGHITSCKTFTSRQLLAIDHATRRNLELTHAQDGSTKGSLVSVIDRTVTPMGARLLKSWLLSPLRSIEGIRERHDAVEELLAQKAKMRALREALSSVLDMERLIVRLKLLIATPRDLVALKSSMERVPQIRALLEGLGATLIAGTLAKTDALEDLHAFIGRAIVDSPPAHTRDGGVIRPGFDEELDRLKGLANGGKDWIASFEASERERTGINNLKVGYNRVFGYYIEITRSNLSSAPPEYSRKQTLVNAERFITPELKVWEDKVLNAEERSKALEQSLFSQVCEKVAKEHERVSTTARALSVIDVLASYATIAGQMDYSRPEVVEEDAFEVEGGRHPAIETVAEQFVPNDLKLDEDARLIILTGPNMAGKSTYLRQNALIAIMAHAGSFVPATRARIGLLDRIFTRVGASDDLMRGASTFMVEMSETANILNSATERSLVILDEIGRGTSTFDGLSIAWAVSEHLHDTIGAKTVFATHYHELTELTLTKQRVKNYNMSVREWDGKVIFLRKVVLGGASRSYGIQVARLAGVPSGVIKRAKEILANLEREELGANGVPRIAADEPLSLNVCASHDNAVLHQLSLLGSHDEVRERLKALDIERMTPIEALAELDRLKRLLDKG